MKRRLLGSTGLEVSVVALGALTFGREVDRHTAFRILDLYVERGGNFLDTADVYSKGLSETILGEWLSSRADTEHVIVASKVGHKWTRFANDRGLTRKHIFKAVEGSLRRLRRDTIDLYQTHIWDNLTPIEETLYTFKLLIDQGKIQYVGVSNFCGWQLNEAHMVSLHIGMPAICCVQPQYSLLERCVEWELIPVALRKNISVMPWSPLGGGWLSGKYHRDIVPSEPSRLGQKLDIKFDSWEVRNNDRTWRIVDSVKEIAHARDVPPIQVAINWLLSRPAVTAPIVGARTPEQLQEILDSLQWTLDEQEERQLTAVSDPGLPHPYDFIQRVARSI